MSHFTLIVELPVGTEPDDYEEAIKRLLMPFDEDEPTEPYRVYVDGGAPKDAAYFEALRDKGHFGDTPDDEVTWERYVAAHNERFAPEPDDESGLMHLDAESGRAYTLSTYNPDSKWDWWTIGGRWRGYFTHVEKLSPEDDDRLLLSVKRWMNESRELKDRACDGGPIRLLDFDTMREVAAARASERCDRYERAIAGTPEALTWTEARESHEKIDDAREFYRSQPRVQALNEAFSSEFSMGCYLEEFRWGRELYVHRARLSAVPGYAYLTRDGKWLAPGDMGWFGMSSDTVESREAYDIAVNGRIASLDPNTVLVLIDCHI